MVRTVRNRRNGRKLRRSLRGGVNSGYTKFSNSSLGLPGARGTYICCFIDDDLKEWIKIGWGNETPCEFPLVINVNNYNIHQNKNFDLDPFKDKTAIHDYFTELFDIKDDQLSNGGDKTKIDHIKDFLITKNVYLVNPRLMNKDAWQPMHHIMQTNGFIRPQIDKFGLKHMLYKGNGKNIVAFKTADGEIFAYKLPNPYAEKEEDEKKYLDPKKKKT